MLTTILIASSKTPMPESYDLTGAVAWAKAFGLLCLLVVIVYLTGRAWLKHGKSGDINGSFSFVGAVFICLIPLALISGVGILTGTGAAMLGTVLKVLS